MDSSNERRQNVYDVLIELIQRPVTATVVLASIVTSIAYWGGVGTERLLLNQAHIYSEPWRWITSVLVHADFLHLAFNAYWACHFGILVETNLGKAKTAALLLLFGVGSSAAEFAFLDGGIGLSGVNYGLFGLLWVLGRHDPRFRGAVDGRLVRLFLGWFLLCVVLTSAEVWNVGNIAHGAGVVLGYLAGRGIVATSGHRPLWRALLAVGLAGVMALATVGRQYVNLGNDMASVLFGQARAAWEDEDYEAAVDIYRDLLRHDDSDPGAWFNLGLALARLGQLEEALENFDRATQLDPGDADGHHLRGLCLRDLGRLEEAIEALDRALQVAPDDGTYHAERAWCLWESDHKAEALEALGQAVELGSDNARVFKLRGEYLSQLERYDDALESLDRAIELAPDDAGAHGSRGWCLVQLERFQEALRALNRAVRITPDDSWFHTCRAWCLWELKYQTEALEVLGQAIELDPTNSRALGLRGMYLSESGRVEEALAPLDRTLELDPDNGWALGLRAWCLYELRRFEEARRDSSRALELDPDDDWARHLLALIGDRTSQD